MGRINIVKMSVPPKTIYRLYTISIKRSVRVFKELEQIILKFVRKHKRC